MWFTRAETANIDIMKGPVLVPFYAGDKALSDAIRIGGVETVILPYREKARHAQSPGGWYWGNPGVTARQLRLCKKLGADVGVWVVWQDEFGYRTPARKLLRQSFGPLPKRARWVDEHGRSYEVTPCPASDWQIKRLQGYLSLAKKLGCRYTVMDNENYASRFSQFNGRKAEGGTFGLRDKPICHCGRHPATAEGTWRRCRALTRRMDGQAFFPHQWVLDQFRNPTVRGEWSENTYNNLRDYSGVLARGGVVGVNLSSRRGPEAQLEYAAEAHRKCGNRWWIWDPSICRGAGPGPEYWRKFRDATKQ